MIARYYLKFRPLLMSDATRIVGSTSEAEEVVQETFLYFMTSSAEISNETEALRYLRWKNKNISIDRVRRNRKDQFLTSEIEPELLTTSESPSEFIERADDAAIVALALARMEERQRYALIATAYEEKSASALAEELRLSPNASRQLLHRARRSFSVNLKLVLQDRGITVESFLGGRFAKHLGIVSSIAGVLVVLGIANPLIFGSSSTTTALAPYEATETSTETSGSLEPDSGLGSRMLQSPIEDPMSTTLEIEPLGSKDMAMEGQVSPKIDKSQVPNPTSPTAAELNVDSGSDQPDTQQQLAMATLVGREMLNTLIAATSGSNFTDSRESSPGVLELRISSEASLAVGYTYRDFTPVIDFFWLQLSPGGNDLVALPLTLEARLIENSESQTLRLVATDFILGDIGGKYGHTVNADSHLSINGVLVNFEVQGEKLRVVDVSFSNRESSSP